MKKDEISDAPQRLESLEESLYFSISLALESDDSAKLRQYFEDIYPADIARLIEQLTPPERTKLLKGAPDLITPETYSHMHPELRANLLAETPAQTIATVLAELESDDAIDILEDLTEELQTEILTLLPNQERLLYKETLTFPDDSAGRIMRREAALIPDYWTVGQTIDYLRAADDEVPTDFYSLIVVGRDHHPRGIIPLSRLVKNSRHIPVARLMDRTLHTVKFDEDQEAVSKIFRQYGIAELPVIDASDRLVGVITLDDALEVVDEEGEEDILMMGGLSHNDFFDDLKDTLKARLPWLSVNLITAILASLVIFAFEDTLSKIVALAILMPITASMGGNAGTQTLTVAVRALASGQLTAGNMLRAISKEASVGLLNGVIFALVVGALTTLWYNNITLGMAIGLAMILAMTIAGLSGVLVPLLLSWTRIDPAIASGVFLTTITDVVGFGAFLLLSSWIL